RNAGPGRSGEDNAEPSPRRRGDGPRSRVLRPRPTRPARRTAARGRRPPTASATGHPAGERHGSRPSAARRPGPASRRAARCPDDRRDGAAAPCPRRAARRRARSVEPASIDGDVVACWLRPRAGVRPIAVHPGWRTDLETAVAVVMAATRDARTPEPLRLARRAAREARVACGGCAGAAAGGDRTANTGPTAASVSEHYHPWRSELRRATRLLPASRLAASVRLGRLRGLRVARGIAGAVPRRQASRR